MKSTRWKQIEWSGWQKNPNNVDDPNLAGQFVAIRDDGTIFYETAIQPSLDKLKRDARLKLDRFLEVE